VSYNHATVHLQKIYNKILKKKRGIRRRRRKTKGNEKEKDEKVEG